MDIKNAQTHKSSPQALDPTFGTDGIVSFSDTLGANAVAASAQNKSGELLFCGYQLDQKPVQWIIKLHASGKVDTSFGTGGFVGFDVGRLDGSRVAMSVTIGICQTDTRILVVGWTEDKALEELTVVGVRIDGSIDSDFGTNGVKRLPIGNEGESSVRSKANAGTEAGTLYYHNALIIPTQGAVVRLNEEGELDTSFNGTGILPIKNGINMTIGVQPADNKILIGNNNNSEKNTVEIYRYTDTGIIDETFGRNGVYKTTVPEHTISTLVADLNGVITYLGVPDQNNAHHFLAQLLGDGTVDPDFNGGERVELRLLNNNIYTYDGYMTIDEQNRRHVAVTSLTDTGGVGVLLRYLRNGSLDVTLGDGGMFVTPLGDGRGIYLRGMGKLAMVGQTVLASTGQVVGII